MTIQMVQRQNESSLEKKTLTHVGAVKRMIINAVITPWQGRDVVDVLMHSDGPHAPGFGMTTDRPKDLIEAGLILVQAGLLLDARQKGTS